MLPLQRCKRPRALSERTPHFLQNLDASRSKAVAIFEREDQNLVQEERYEQERNQRRDVSGRDASRGGPEGDTAGPREGASGDSP